MSTVSAILCIFCWFTFGSYTLAYVNSNYTAVCPHVTNLSAVTPQTLNGPWYEIQRLPNTLTTQECVQVFYTNFTDNNDEITAKYSQKNFNDGAMYSFTVNLTKYEKKDGRYEAKVNENPNIEQIRYNFLYVGYNFAIVWGCSYDNNTDINIQRFSVLSRTRGLNDTQIIALEVASQVLNLPFKDLKDVIQNDEKCRSETNNSNIVSIATVFMYLAVVLISKYTI